MTQRISQRVQKMHSSWDMPKSYRKRGRRVWCSKEDEGPDVRSENMSERNIWGVRHHYKYSMSKYREKPEKGPEERQICPSFPVGSCGKHTSSVKHHAVHCKWCCPTSSHWLTPHILVEETVKSPHEKGLHWYDSIRSQPEGMTGGRGGCGNGYMSGTGPLGCRKNHLSIVW